MDGEKESINILANLWYWATGGLATLATLEGVWPSCDISSFKGYVGGGSLVGYLHHREARSMDALC